MGSTEEEDERQFGGFVGGRENGVFKEVKVDVDVMWGGWRRRLDFGLREDLRRWNASALSGFGRGTRCQVRACSQWKRET